MEEDSSNKEEWRKQCMNKCTVLQEEPRSVLPDLSTEDEAETESQ